MDLIQVYLHIAICSVMVAALVINRMTVLSSQRAQRAMFGSIAAAQLGQINKISLYSDWKGIGYGSGKTKR